MLQGYLPFLPVKGLKGGCFLNPGQPVFPAMADSTVQKLLRFLRPDHPEELRRAAALVLGEVASRNGEVDQALCQALDDPDPDLRAQVLGAIGKLKVEPALPRLLARVGEGGPEAELAAQAAARLGAKGTKALRDIMGKAAPG